MIASSSIPPIRSGGPGGAHQRTRPPGGKQVMNRLAATAAVIVSAILAGCTVGPKYQRPVAPAPSAWSSEGPWRAAAPKDAIPKGAWWEAFHDDQLNHYEQQLLAANQSLAAAQDRLSRARSLARVASAGLFPTMSTDPSASGARYSGNRPGSTTPDNSTDAKRLPDTLCAELRGRSVRSRRARLSKPLMPTCSLPPRICKTCSSY